MELLAFGKTGWGDELFYATLMTIAVSITAMLVGFLFALIFTPLKLSKYKLLNLIGNIYTTVIRGVPELLVIYLFFFGGSGAIMYVASIFGYFEYIEINAFITGSFAIGIISVTGLVEIMRQSYIAAGSTRDPLFFYSFAAVLYLLLTFLSMKIINRLELKYSRGY